MLRRIGARRSAASHYGIGVPRDGKRFFVNNRAAARLARS
jgi:hypothetical protein